MIEDKIIFVLEHDFPAGTTPEAAHSIIGALNEEFRGKCVLIRKSSLQNVRRHPFSQRFSSHRKIANRLEQLLAKDGRVEKKEVVFTSSSGFYVEYDRRRWAELSDVQQADEILRQHAIWQRRRQMEQVRHEFMNLDHLPERHRLIVETAVSLLPEYLQLLFLNMGIRFNIQEGTPFAFASAFNKDEPITNREIYLPADLDTGPNAVQLVVHELIHHLHHHFEMTQAVETDEERELLRTLQERNARRFAARYAAPPTPAGQVVN